MATAKKKTATKTKTKAKAKKASPKPKLVKATKEPKVTKAPKEPKIDTSRQYIEDPKFNLESHDGEKSGDFIKRMLETNALTTAEIVEAVQNSFAGSKAGPADVAFHRLQLKKQGVKLDLVRLDKEGKRYIRNAE